ncbi:hypothetical protein Ade02nite_19460 [Paractinoplanes deccanensis]|uniref:DUF1273 family protein n=2 Tax=Paractinoplanes deccanensis TaxID=113561 RepID=A0ABQ3Y0C1_9ACTN|nr:hypothetical protein Ade02nite_19460 [Actinoplanes deccanensis]
MVTGHRIQHLTPDMRPWVRAELARLAVKLRDEHGMTAGICGMAIGADLWWADAVVRAGLRLEAHVPFPQQPNKWRDEDRAEWSRLLGLAAQTVTYGDGYDVRLLHRRNEGMIRACSAAVAVFDTRKSAGGTASAVRKLIRAGVPVVHVDPVGQRTTLRRTQSPSQVA